MDIPEDVRAKFRAWGKKGGEARSRNLSPAQRLEIATKASAAAKVARKTKELDNK